MPYKGTQSDPADKNSEQPPPKKWGERDCKSDKVCEVAHDQPPGFSNGQQVLDLYTMKLTRSKYVLSDFSYKGNFSGLICNHDLSCRDVLYLYKVKPEDATQYLDFDQQDQYSITLNGPQGGDHLVDGRSSKTLYFALLLDHQSLIRGPANSLKDSEVFGEKRVGSVKELFIPLMCTPESTIYNKPYEKLVMEGWGLPIDIAVQCAIMYPGAVAKITIQILNRPTNVHSIIGTIYARPCTFTDRIPLISKDDSILLNKDSTILLKRCLLAVSSLASLVIEVGPLTDQDGKDLIPYLGPIFVPSIDGSEIRTIKDDGGDERFKVQVKWQIPMD